MKNDGASVRQSRMSEMAIQIQKQLAQHNPLILSKVVSGFAYQFGLRKEKVIEYIEILADLGQFQIDKEKDEIRKVTS